MIPAAHRCRQRAAALRPGSVSVGENVLDRLQLIRGQGRIGERTDRIVDLSGAAGPHQRRGDLGMPQDPGDGELRQGLPAGLGEGVQAADFRELIVGDVLGP